MKLTLRDNCFLKRLEDPYIYDSAEDELYLLDQEAFTRILALTRGTDDPESARLLDEAGLLQRGPRRLPAFKEGSSGEPSLRYLELQITGMCDKACRHCYLGAPTGGHMEPGTFADILEEFSAMQGLKVMVSGGEPACHPRFQEVADLLRGHPLRSVLVTHGEWVGRKEASRLAGCFNQVQVSLDGLRNGHDALRGEGSFDRATQGIRNLRGAGVPVSVATMAHGQNLDQFEAMSDLVRDLGVHEWDIDVPCPAGRWLPAAAEREVLGPASEKLRHAFGGGYHGGAGGLACGSHLMTVAPDGKAAKCGFYLDSPAGDVREGLASVWRRVEHLTLDALQCECDQLEQCAGGCRFRAMVLAGSELAPDPVQCHARGVKKFPVRGGRDQRPEAPLR